MDDFGRITQRNHLEEHLEDEFGKDHLEESFSGII